MVVGKSWWWFETRFSTQLSITSLVLLSSVSSSSWQRAECSTIIQQAALNLLLDMFYCHKQAGIVVNQFNDISHKTKTTLVKTSQNH